MRFDGATRALALCALSLALAGLARAVDTAAPAGHPAAGVWLKVLDARSPPGGQIELTVGLTEPRPIVTARARLGFSPAALGNVTGAALLGPSGSASDAAGVAVVGTGELTVRATSNTGEMGTALGVPVLTVSIAVPSGARLGPGGALTVDTARSAWFDPSGQPYSPQTVKDGSFEVAGSLAVADVLPALGLLPPGSAVTVRGMGFQPGANVEIDGVPVAAAAVSSGTEIVATLGAAADLYGRRVRVRNPDLSLAHAFAYPRTVALAPSGRPLLAAALPIFSPRAISSAALSTAAAPGQFLGVALQNPGAAPARVTLELRSLVAGPVASAVLSLPGLTRTSREVAELFPGATSPADGLVVVRSDVPLQVLGLLGDEAAGTLSPVVPVLAAP